MSSSKEPQHKEDAEATEATTAEDEDTGAQVVPIVKLQEVALSTGEENEHVLLDMKAKLYRFDKEGNQWKERGVGTVKLLEHKETGKVRLVMRQSKTLKICANHRVLAAISIQEHAGNDKSCVWHATDFADGELKDRRRSSSAFVSLRLRTAKLSKKRSKKLLNRKRRKEKAKKPPLLRTFWRN